jgi:hypothetical protein
MKLLLEMKVPCGESIEQFGKNSVRHLVFSRHSTCNFGTLRGHEGIFQCHARVPPRKDIPSNQKMSRKTLRFTPADIVRAIDGFEAAGLQVCGVEITPTGIIKMTGGPTSISQLRKQPPTPTLIP